MDQGKRRMIHTEHDCAHDACCDEKLHGMENIHRIASVFIEKNQIQNSRYTEVRIRRPCCAEHAPRRDGGEIPGEEDLHTRRNNHVQERDRGLTHPLQHACRDLLHTEQKYAEAHDGDTRTGIAGRVQHIGDRSRDNTHPDESRYRDEIGQTHRRVRTRHDDIILLLRDGFRNDRHQTGRQRRRHDSRHIDERRRHACQIAEECRRFFDSKSCHFQTTRHDQQIDIRNDRQHDIRQRNRNGKDQQSFDDRHRTLRLDRGILLRGQLLTPVSCHVIEPNQDKDPHKSTRCCPQRSARGSELQTIRQQDDRESDHRHDTDDLL